MNTDLIKQLIEGEVEEVNIPMTPVETIRFLAYI